MLTLTRLLGLRSLRLRWDRTLLVIASIALGVGTLVSSRLLNFTIDAAATQTIRPLAVADLFVTNGDVGVRRDLADRLKTIPGVRLVQPILIERVLLPDLHNRTAMLLGVESTGRETIDTEALGITVEPAPAWQLTLALLSGRAVFVGAELADDLRAAGVDGVRLNVRVASTVKPLNRAGTLRLSGAAAAVGRNLLVMDAAQAGKLLGRPGLVSRIDIFLAPGADAKAVRAAVEPLLGGADVQTPENHGQAAQEVLSGVQIAFNLCGAGALVVGLFLVYNALSVSVAERRREIGILRSIGATRGQIAGLFAAEATLMGLVGALLGVPLGLGLAHLALSLLRDVLSQLFAAGTVFSVQLDITTAALGVSAGLITALAATLIPALQAAFDEPADAVRRVPSGWTRYLLLAQIGLSLTLIGVGVTFITLRRSLPGGTGSHGGMAIALTGLLLAAPLATTVIARFLRPLARVLFGLEARLAADNLLRAPGRTGLVIGVLAAGVAMILQIAGIRLAMEEPILAWVERSVQAELFVNVAGGEGVGALPMDASVGELLEKTPGVSSVMAVRFRTHKYRYTSIITVAIDSAVYLEATQARNPYPELAQFARLSEPGTALASENFAALHRVGVGETATLQGPTGPVSLRIVGIIPDYTWNRGTLVLDRRASYAGAFADPLVDVYDLFAAPGTDVAALKRHIQDAGVERALVVFDRQQLRGLVTTLVRQAFALAYVQLVLICIVAALGVVTALLISVLQRRRELGLLRAVGAARAQILRSVLAEATLMGLIGTLFGVLVALPLQWYIVKVIIFEESGFVFPFALPVVEALAIGMTAVTISTLAGLAPAWHAARLPIAEAIAYE